jgi:hypothetical protein
VECRVEAGDGRDPGQGCGHRVEHRQRLRLVQGRHLDQLAQAFLDAGVDQNRLTEPLPAMNDPMSDGVSITEPVA